MCVTFKEFDNSHIFPALIEHIFPKYIIIVIMTRGFCSVRKNIVHHQFPPRFTFVSRAYPDLHGNTEILLVVPAPFSLVTISSNLEQGVLEDHVLHDSESHSKVYIWIHRL